MPLIKVDLFDFRMNDETVRSSSQGSPTHSARRPRKASASTRG